MAGLASTFSSPRSNPHHFHPHHRQPLEQRPPAVDPIDGNDRRGSSRAPSGFTQSSKPLSFPVERTPSSVAGLRHPEVMNSGSPSRRHSDDPSSYLRSEWVTLSKAMLMVLVEKICQLSFENEPTPPPPGTTLDLRDSSSRSSGISRSKDADDAKMDHHHSSSDGGDKTPEPHEETSTPNRQEDMPEAPFQAHTLASPAAPASPSTDASGERQRTLQSTSGNYHNRRCSETSGLKVGTRDAAPGQEAKASEADDRSSYWIRRSGVGSDSGRRRSSKRKHRKLPMGGRAGKSREYGVGVEGKAGSGVDDRMRTLKLRPLRQHNGDRDFQSWVAFNKSLVYSMIDSALADAQQVSASANGRDDVTTARHRDAAVDEATVTNEDDVVTRTSAVDGPLKTRCGDGQLPPPQQPVARQKTTTTDSPLLGALLSYDEVIVTEKNDPMTHPPLPRHGRLSTSRPGCRPRVDAAWDAAAARALTIGPGATWRLPYSSGDLPFPLPGQNPPLVGQTADVNIRRVPFTGAGPAGQVKSSRGSNDEDAQASPRSDGDPGSVEPKRRSSDLCERRRLGSDGGVRSEDLGLLETVDRTTPVRSGSDLGRPLWIALDKSEVCSLVDSLVSKMMSEDDVTRLTSARRRNSVSNDNSSHGTGDGVLDTVRDCGDKIGHHEAVAYERSGNQDDDAAVDFSKTNADHHGNVLDYDGVVEPGDHGNGTKRTRRKYDIRCLLVKQSEEGVPSGAAESDWERDREGHASLRRQDSRTGGEGSKGNLKWKSNMMLRLHTQSQDGKTA